jgi:integrase/recombinase XerD
MGITLGKKQLNKGRVSLYLNYSYNGKRRVRLLRAAVERPVLQMRC